MLQVIIPSICFAIFVAILAWSWKLASRTRFGIDLTYMSYSGTCNVDLKQCYGDAPLITPTSSPDNNSDIPGGFAEFSKANL